MTRRSSVHLIRHWILERLRTTYPNHPNAHQGMVTLKGSKDYEDKMIDYIYLALMQLVQRMSHGNDETMAGQAKLNLNISSNW